MLHVANFDKVCRSIYARWNIGAVCLPFHAGKSEQSEAGQHSNADREVCTGGSCKLDFRFFSIVRHASTQLRKPATRGIASQHLQTFERWLASVTFCIKGTVPFCIKGTAYLIQICNQEAREFANDILSAGKLSLMFAGRNVTCSFDFQP